ncbi:MAG TPA: hypothetical protein VMB34_16375 [Acetobacteraceae bacterium]|nr:hypothetical protein [Acetobacteraceae bacterium]
MPRDPLRVLLRLRGITLDAARRALAERLRDEAVAAARAAGLAAAMDAEAAARRGLPDAAATDIYAAWLSRMQGARHAAQDAVQRSAAAASEARTVVGSERAAARALESALAHARQAHELTEARAEQSVLDEAALLCHRDRAWSG